MIILQVIEINVNKISSLLNILKTPYSNVEDLHWLPSRSPTKEKVLPHNS